MPAPIFKVPTPILRLSCWDRPAEDDAMDEQEDVIPGPECGGTGKVPLVLDNLPGPIPPLEIDCPICGGTGFVRTIPKRQD
jgi:hypothetical protein